MLTSVYVFIVKYFSALPPNPPAASPKVRRNNLVRWRDFIKSVPSFKAAPHNSASRFGERFFIKSRFEKRGNTVCTRKGYAASVSQLTPATAALYFELFKPQNWRKRFAEARRRNCAVLP